ncbi:hypothetical protein PAXRUDRAFT_833973 [Paxillus rubicundulus Ve08.2h10]|uniref:Uncharacterized protein n=1 Tax=Paxillus rubicundulus Ve08.2h10 TaxID=930991 RepID=A0A0D0DMJ6_9AGAM|nr:hypothetical protein PAXRUDRAFT_833973 [Paxillus rubicundulus Ve08.2h10]
MSPMTDWSNFNSSAATPLHPRDLRPRAFEISGKCQGDISMIRTPLRRAAATGITCIPDSISTPGAATTHAITRVSWHRWSVCTNGRSFSHIFVIEHM